MRFKEWDSLSEELSRVKRESHFLLKLKNRRLTDFISLELEDPPMEALPALVLAGALHSFKSHGDNPDGNLAEKVYGMASIFQLVYLTSEVHRRIGDEEGAECHNPPNYYFPVLIGDYIYGRLLRRLCEIGCCERLPRLASVICDMNEGALKRKELAESRSGDENALAVIDQEYGSLFKEAGLVGLWLGGGDPRSEEPFGEMSRYIGTALGAMEHGFDLQLINTCRREAVYHHSRLGEGSLKVISKHLLRFTEPSENSLMTACGQ